MKAYLSQRHQKDICLNTFRYNRVNISSHALWIPFFLTLKLARKTVLSRQGVWSQSYEGLDSFYRNR